MNPKQREIRNNAKCMRPPGEFAVLTLGRTKGIDILVSNPKTGRMLKLEVKTNFRSSRSAGGNSRLFGKFLSAWMMNEKHEAMRDPNLFYFCCETLAFRFFVVLSRVFPQKKHRHWLDEKETHRDSTMRKFQIGYVNEKYPIPTPIADEYEDKWSLLD